MLTKSKIAWGILTIATLSLTTACSGSDEIGDGEGEIGTTKLALNGENGLTPNGLTGNGLTGNGLTGNGLTGNGLTGNGLTGNGLAMAALEDTLTQQFFSYLVSCALPENQSITLTLGGVPVTFEGGLGLAPEWGVDGGSCDTNCQEWVSACLLSRVNYYGQHVALSLRGPTSALATTPDERAAFPEREGAYWGNIFTATPAMYACRERTPAWTDLITRSCGPRIFNSIMVVRAYCDKFCDPATDSTDGYYQNCMDLTGNPHPTVTVYRQ